MARPYTVRVGHRVTYYDAAGKPQPAIVLAVGSTNGGVRLRRLGTATVIGDATTGILRGSIAEGVRTNVWAPR